MRVGSEPSQFDSFRHVKEAFERNYKCLGISCADVGGLWTVDGYAPAAKPCGNGASGIDGGDDNQAGVIVGSIIGVSLGLGLLIFAWWYSSRQTGTERASGIPLDNADGEPLVEEEDIDGEPLDMDNVDGEQRNEVDGGVSCNPPLNQGDNVHDDNRVSHDGDGKLLERDLDVEGIPLDQDDADGESLDEDEDIDGEPCDMENVDGEQLDELDGGVKSIKVETSSNPPLNKDDNVHDDNRLSHDVDGQPLGKDLDVDGIPLYQDDANGEPLVKDEDFDGEPNVHDDNRVSYDADGQPLNKDINGEGIPLDNADGEALVKEEDIDGEPLGMDTVDGEQLNEVDGGVESLKVENSCNPPLNQDDNVHDDNRVSLGRDGKPLERDLDVEGIPLDQDDANGDPLVKDEDIDGEPFDTDDADGEPLEEDCAALREETV
jgi:hypothetical protein